MPTRGLQKAFSKIFVTALVRAVIRDATVLRSIPVILCLNSTPILRDLTGLCAGAGIRHSSLPGLFLKHSAAFVKTIKLWRILSLFAVYKSPDRLSLFLKTRLYQPENIATTA